MLLWALLACQDDAPEGAINLARHPELVQDLVLPPSSRDDAAPEGFLLTEWTEKRRGEGVIEWAHPLPFEHVHFGHSRRKRPFGMTLSVPWNYKHDQLKSPSWQVTARELLVRRSEGAGPPPKDLRLLYDRAQTLSRRLNLEHSELSPEAFAFGPVEPLDTSRRGVLLPAPGSVTWSVELPRDAHLSLRVLQLPAPLKDGVSDGAELVVEVDGVEVKRRKLQPTGWRRMNLDLDRKGTVQIRLRSECAGTCDRDYLFIEEPAVYTPKDDPRRVVMVFIDTLRADHLGVYGYQERPTSPVLDAWAEDAAVFEQARAPAPWTLPSARSALSGEMPDAWDPEQSLPAVLAREGFFTDAVVTNAFLTSRFGMGGSWSRYRYAFLESASSQIDAALDSLELWPDRDKLLLIHLMDPHVPYQEPEPYKSQWVGEMPEALEGMPLGRELRALSPEDHEAAATYLKARYDQNIAYLDAQLQRLFDALDEDDIVVVYSDHGEEFFEHASFEHGHSLYDELLRVPLIIKGPGMQPGKRSDVASLMDIAPTVLGMLGLPNSHQGVDLRQPAPPRTLGFGWTLYGPEGWAVLREPSKIISLGGEREAFDVVADPLEQQPVELPEDWRAVFEEGLERPMHDVWRVIGNGHRKDLRAVPLRLTHPDGFSDAWSAYDPIDVYNEPVIDGDTVEVPKTENNRMPREFFVVPKGPYDSLTFSVGAWTAKSIDGVWTTGGWRVEPDVAPSPVGSTTQMVDEATEELRVLGYLD